MLNGLSSKFSPLGFSNPQADQSWFFVNAIVLQFYFYETAKIYAYVKLAARPMQSVELVRNFCLPKKSVVESY
jgi:hypothetical protein